ncbi:sodium:proton antiporter, partial [Candidatus Woesearchaeota archaeon CG11_big_fil_rev_8_21_14_0_20_57_5]
TDLHSLSLRALPIIGILFVIAIISKLVSGWGCQKKVASRLGVGIGMIPRGEVGLIFATIGLSGGIISAELYGILVIVIMATTLVTPPVLRPVLLAQGKKEV